MTSNQCFLPSKIRVEGELMSQKILSPKIFEQATAFLLTAHCLAFPKVQSSHGLKVLATWIHIALVVAWVIDLDGWPSLTWRLPICFLQGAVADCALYLFVSWRKLTLATQLSWVLIWQSRMILPTVDLTMILFWWSLEIFFPYKSSHVRENRFTPVLGTDHIVWTHSVLSLCQTLMWSMPLLVSGIFQSLIESTHWCQWCQIDWYCHSWCDMMHQRLQSMYSLWTKKCVPINDTHHTCLGSLFNIFHELTFFSTFCFNLHHQQT